MDCLLPSPKMDTDGDGVSNLMEFYTGTRPDDSSSVARPSVNIVEDGEGNKFFMLKMSPSPSAQGVNVYVELSDDLINWQSAKNIVEWQKQGPVMSAILLKSINSSRSTYLRVVTELD